MNSGSNVVSSGIGHQDLHCLIWKQYVYISVWLFIFTQLSFLFCSGIASYNSDTFRLVTVLTFDGHLKFIFHGKNFYQLCPRAMSSSFTIFVVLVLYVL